MKRIYETNERATEVLKQAIWLAWKASGHEYGMGVFQSNPSAQRDEVWNQAYNERDYSGRHSIGNDLNADYVFGRMMKLRVRRPQSGVLEMTDSPPTSDYQAWCHTYKTYDALFDAAESVTP